METKTFTYKVVDEDNHLLADLHWQKDSPTTKDGNRHPIALILHGGGLVVGSKDIIPKPQISYLTKAGFLVLIPNYRLCPQVSAFEGPITDSKDCLTWAINNADSLLRHESGNEYLVDSEKVVVMGHSAGGGLALTLSNQSDLPVRISAVLDFYGSKYLDDISYWEPHPWFTGRAETWDEEYMNRVFDGPQVSAADPYLGTEMPPPRDAWLTSHMKKGTWLKEVIRDGDTARIDGASGFSEDFPPTMFIHGLSDTFTSCAVSKTAYAQLRDFGVAAELLLVPGKDHMFDLILQEGDQEFLDFVTPGLDFLVRKVGLPS